MIKLLVIEDETAIRNLIRLALPENDFIMHEASNTKEAEIALSLNLPDLIVLDWMLPGKSGIDFIQWLRQHQQYEYIPVIILTAKAEEHSKIKGLTHGADDYMTKPFSPAELIARIKTILRRGRLIKQNDQLQFGPLLLDCKRQQIKVNNELLALRPMEYKILLFFITHPGKIFSREQLITFIWGQTTYIDERTIDVNIGRIRNKLKAYQCADLVKTVHGSGYICEVTNE